MINKQAKMAETEDAHDGEAEMRVYELGFHLDPELPTEESKKAYKAIRDLITSHGAIVVESEPQMIQLAYTISRQETTGRRDFNSAYFAWIAYEADTTSHAAVLSAVGADTRVIRFIDLVTTKDAARYAIEIRDFATKKEEPTPESEPEPEATTDVELDTALQNVGI